MSLTAKGFEDLLTLDSYVDLESLREASFHGIPDQYRCDSWKYLLGVTTPSKSEELSLQRQLKLDYEADTQRTNTQLSLAMKPEINRLRSHSNDPSFNEEKFDQIKKILIGHFDQHSNIKYQEGMVSLVVPFVTCCSDEVLSYFLFRALMEKIESSFHQLRLNTCVNQFRKYFRILFAELYTYFEDEEVSVEMFFPSWFLFLLSRELPLENVMRLWDTYFSMNDSFDELHIYVCLAILEQSQETLLEYEHSEIKCYLHQLPSFDMDFLISEAKNIQDAIFQSNLNL
ncbi:hypothetical protein M0811_03457 [Anaeramoeba ignava]|uniref:Rab-GAP TBC domain-containing protein n=1 Tax=Anaeramoeba ignava TaxID=1746090 RepID=A0A9Q0L5M2_ANAIG|nr:hypothetical protein M0811_03457 [Anaeramoeba ignava]